MASTKMKHMATTRQTILNKKTGEKITWLETAADTGGKRLVFHFEVAPRGRLPVMHFHPHQTETLELSKGFLTVNHGDKSTILTAGERIVIGKGVPHQWCNASFDTAAEMTVTFEPALNTETFLEQFYGLSNDDKTAEDGTPAFLQLMAMVNEYQVYVQGPPLFLQKIMGWVLGGVGRLIGYKKYYSRYRES